MNQNVLPDSRLTRSKQVVYFAGGYWAKVFCANCGKDGPLVPEENMTFAFYLCNPCFATHGEIVNTYIMPDEVFWEKVKQEQLEACGRFLTEAELVEIVAADASPLATLIKQRR